ncbi:XkdX family protein [Ligilactobacillus salivarius]|uniref:XkdX family protein n=1 Tax=Ligilactobacillus salivarius TaxID=1624 RepID=A0A1Y0F8D3_9LACO|nr:XkdX family protein [Ligilactobacillus salivarius]ARU19600.1 XkdX family protein [Ligilactobacillus salivarius]QXL48844.1 XkdX family protein [Ligilactobacillus salivarius]
MIEAMYTMFKEYYSLGLFTVDDCRLAVQVHYFGKEQFKEITGVDYDVPTVAPTV